MGVQEPFSKFSIKNKQDGSRYIQCDRGRGQDKEREERGRF